MASKNTLSTLSIGFVADTSKLKVGIDQALGGFQHLAQAGNAALSPALQGVGAAGANASLGLGKLEHLIEVLGLRILSTSTQMSNLAQAMRRGTRGQQQFSSASQKATRAVEQEQQALRELGGTVANLNRQSATRSRRAGRIEVIDGDGEISKLVRIRREIRSMAEARQREQMAERAGKGIPSQIAALESQRAGAPGSNQIEINEMIARLKTEQVQIGMQLRAQEDASDSTSAAILSKQREMQALSDQRMRTQSKHVSDYKMLLAAKQKAAKLKQQPPPSLAQHISEWKSVTVQLNASNAKIANINGQMSKSLGDEQRLLTLEKERTAELVKRGVLQQQHASKTDEIHALESQKKGAASELRDSIEAQKARGQMTDRGLDASSVNYRISQQYTKELQKHSSHLQKNVALGNITQKQAEHQLQTFKRINTQQMTGMIKNQRQIVAGGGRMAYAMQNFGFMIEDGASQLGTRGLAGAVGAMSNNLTAMVSVLARNPMTLIFTSVGVAVTQLLLQTGALEKAFAAMGFAAKKADEDTKSLARTMKELAAAQKASYEQAKAIHELQTSGSGDSLRTRIKEERQQIIEAQVKADAAAAEWQIKKDESRTKELEAELAAIGESAQSRAELLKITMGAADPLGLVPESQHLVTREMLMDMQVRERAAKKELRGIQERQAKLASGMSKEQTDAQAAARKLDDSKARLHTAESMRVKRLAQEQLKAEDDVMLARREGQNELKAFRESRMSDAQKIALAEKELAQLATDISSSQANLDKGGVNGTNHESRMRQEDEINEKIKKAISLQQELDRIRATGVAARNSAIDMMHAARTSVLSKEDAAEQKRRDAREKYEAHLKKALSLKQMTLKETRQARDVLVQSHAAEKKKFMLEEKKKKLEKDFKAKSTPATVQSGVEAGSVEAMGVINQAILDRAKAQEIAPLVAEMQAVATELKTVNTSIKAIPVLNLKKK